MPERVLVIAAHPDDEVLGVGGTVARHVMAGADVHVVIVADCESARRDARGAGAVALPAATSEALRCLGVHPAEHLTFLCFKGMTLAGLELELNRTVERVVRDGAPDVVYTHHPGDLNSDHRAVAQAVLVACRPYGRHATRRVLAFETPSSTEWGGAIAGLPAFTPQVFVDIDNGHLDTKLRAMGCYKDELRPPPHPRGLEALRARAAYWGQVSGCQYAEAFVLLREVVR